MRARDVVRAWTPRLAAAGIDTARLDAELLVAHVLGTDRRTLFLDDPELAPADRVRAEELLTARVETRAPVAQLAGRWSFDGLDLEVTPDVLVPRPETELLVERAAELAPHGAGVIDVGTGSGAIAIALAARRPDLTVTASDVSAPALDVARRNAARLGERRGLVTRSAPLRRSAPEPAPIAFQHASLLGAWRGAVVVSNPPYVEEPWRLDAAPELAHEPDLALYAGEDGLDVIRELLRECAAHDEIELILLEHGHQQGAAIRDLLAEAGFPAATTEPDLGGYDRITWARRIPDASDVSP